MHLPDAQKECTADLYSRKLRFAAAWQPAEDRKEESGDGQSRDCCFDSLRSPCRGWQPPARAAGGRAGCPHRRPARPLPLTAALAWRRLAVRPVVLVLVDQAACHPPRTGACRPGPLGMGGDPPPGSGSPVKVAVNWGSLAPRQSVGTQVGAQASAQGSSSPSSTLAAIRTASDEQRC